MATIRDVAKMCGVSTATVSNVLNGRTDHVGPETRERVLAAVRALKYRPTALERKQKAILTKSLVLMAQDLTEGPLERHGYFHSILDGVLEVAAFRGWGVNLVVQNMWGNLKTEDVIRRSYDGRCDGVIVAAPKVGNELVESLHQRGTPICLVGTTPWLDGVSCVDLDNFAAGQKIARLFMSLGHTRIAFFGGTPEQQSSVERRRGFCQTLEEAGVKPEIILVAKEVSISQSIAELAGRGADRPTAVFCWHDALARTMVSGLIEHGVRVPADMSVAGVDDDSLNASFPVGLTTIVNPVATIGKRAARTMIERLESGTTGDAPEIVRFPPELVVRGSTGPAPATSSSSRHSSHQAIGTNGGSQSQ
ncbi:MAG: LacI family DNA-binding transcriptional regulator [Fimbriimonas sp.]